MDLRPEALAELGKESWARGTLDRRERAWFSVPAMSFGLLAIATALAFMIPSPERVSGRGVVRAPGSVYVRSEAAGAVAAIEVAPGDRVVEGQTLVRLDDPATEGELRRARHRYDEALAAMLRSPMNAALRSEVGNARIALADLRDRFAAQALRSPVAGEVISVRAREGGLVGASDIVATIARTPVDGPASPRLVATFPDATLGVIQAGTELELVVDRSGDHRYLFVVRSVSHEAISIQDPLQRHELASPERADSVLVVDAELVEDSGSARVVLFDGMVGEVRALVRERSLLERISEAMGWRSRL
ncbi:efflux RND transporter periplasmic adaptor subunit [Nannocystaceae bacterium ST9]